VEFRILQGGNKTDGRIATLDIRRVGFGMFRDVLGRVP